MSQVIEMMELQSDDRVDTLALMLGTNDVSRNPFTPETKWVTDLSPQRTEGEV